MTDYRAEYERVSRENAWMRELLGRIATDLQRLSAGSGTVKKAVLAERAGLVRLRMREGPPADWKPTGVPGRVLDD